MTSGQRLKAMRLTWAISQVELAARAGVTQQALSLIERGRSRGSEKTWKCIAAVLDVSPRFFAPGFKADDGDAHERD
jgi:transcriptional regulator with XRE-family HTH domain